MYINTKTSFLNTISIMWIENKTKFNSKPKKTLANIYLRYKSKTLNYLFIRKEKNKLKKAFPKPYQILFSKKDIWSDIIAKSFKKSNIKVHFEDFHSATFANFDLIVPLTIDDLLVCIQKNIELNNQIIPIPSKEAFEICNDKLLFVKTLSANGCSNYLPKFGDNTPFPYILKKQTGEYGKTTFIIENQADELAHQNQLKDGDHFRQQLIKGNKEYATHIIFQNGKIKAQISICYTYDRDTYVQGKMIYVSKAVCENKFSHEFAEVLNAINYEGLCCIDYKIENGLPKIFEINPRFGGSLTDYFFSFLPKLEH